MSEPFLGMIAIFGFNFAPRGWAFCNGQLLPIAQNTALFSLLGTTYGGDGRITFGLPNLQSRVPLHFGQGQGLSNYVLGEMTGSENVTLTVNNLAAHNHTYQIPADSAAGSARGPNGAILGGTNNYSTNPPNAALAVAQTNPAGGSQPFSIIQPILALNFCIALEGIFPSRN